MFRSRLIGVIFGTSLALNGIIVDSALGQNQSDTTGGNTSDVTGGNTSDITGGNTASGGIGVFDNFGVLNDETIQTAEQFANQLRSSRSRRPLSNDRSNTLQRCNIRRFALGPAPSGQNESGRSCFAPEQLSVSPDSRELNTLLENSKAFLERVNQDIEARKSRINNRLW